MTTPPPLLACPFCWKAERLFIGQDDHGTYHFGSCGTCGAEGPISQDENEAIAAWNKRAPAPAVASPLLASLVERLNAYPAALGHGDALSASFVCELMAEAAAALEALAAENGALLDLVKGAADIFEHCSVEMGCCCCGDTVETHSIGSGHSPVDQGAYAVGRWQEQARATLERTPQP